MKKVSEIIKKFYSENFQREWDRLDRDPFHRLEYNTSIKFLKKYLPKNGLILDAGGGPGRYTIELAKMGYQLILLDLTPENLELAKNKLKNEKSAVNVKEIIEGSIVDLSRFKDNTFDAVICLGAPLDHVSPEKERIKAISELIRVAKKDSPIFVSVLSKFGVLTRFYNWIDEVKDTKSFRKFYLTGDDYNWNMKGGFAHFFELNELKSLFNNKVEFLDFVGLEGLAGPCEKQINEMAIKEPKAWKNWLEMHDKICINPLVVEISLHFMVIGRKR